MELENKIKTSGWEKGRRYQSYFNSSSSEFMVMDAAIMYLEDKSSCRYPIARITYHNDTKEFWGTVTFPNMKKNALFIKSNSFEGAMLRLNIFLFENGFDVESPL